MATYFENESLAGGQISRMKAYLLALFTHDVVRNVNCQQQHMTLEKKSIQTRIKRLINLHLFSWSQCKPARESQMDK